MVGFQNGSLNCSRTLSRSCDFDTEAHPAGTQAAGPPRGKKYGKNRKNKGEGGGEEGVGGRHDTRTPARATLTAPQPPRPGLAPASRREGRAAAPDTRRLPGPQRGPARSEGAAAAGAARPAPLRGGRARPGPGSGPHGARSTQPPPCPPCRVPSYPDPRPLTFFLAAANRLCLLPSAMSAPRPGHVSPPGAAGAAAAPPRPGPLRPGTPRGDTAGLPGPAGTPRPGTLRPPWDTRRCPAAGVT